MVRDDNDEDNESLYQRLRLYLIRLKGQLSSTENHQQLINMLMFTIFSLCGAYYRRRRRRRLIPPSYHSAKEAPLSNLFRALQNARDAKLDRVFFGPSVVYYLSRGTWKKSILPRDNPGFNKNLMEKLAPITEVEALPESMVSRFSTPFLTALPFVYLWFVYRMMNQMSGGEVSESYKREKINTTFKDVAGIDDVVTEVAEVVDYLRDPSRFDLVGARPPRGILLFGPPGSGKTLLARAMAGESGVDSFTACSASDFVEMYVGRGAARVRRTFEKARNQARSRRNPWIRRLLGYTCSPSKKPSVILFIDELDALAKTRSTLTSNDEREQTLNQLLTEMDGFCKHEDITMLVIAATNRADILDPAVLRRFDRQVNVNYPDAKGREAILKVHSRRIEIVGPINWESLASDNMTRGFSGADLRNIINDAALLAVREGKKSVEQNNLENAIQRCQESQKCIDNRDALASIMPLQL